ncbi:MAG: hypothetical protein ACO1N9_06840 [Flavobacterium sp.]
MIEEIAYNYEEKQHIWTHQYKNKKRVKSYYASRAYEENKKQLAWKPLLRYQFVYDEKGNKIENHDFENVMYEEKKMPPRIIYMLYNKQNNMIKKILSNSSYIEYSYDSMNRVIEKKVFYIGKVSEASQFKYDDSKILSLAFQHNGDDTTVNFDYKIDKQGNWIEQTKSVDGKKLYIRRRDIKYRE